MQSSTDLRVVGRFLFKLRLEWKTFCTKLSTICRRKTHDFLVLPPSFLSCLSSFIPPPTSSFHPSFLSSLHSFFHPFSFLPFLFSRFSDNKCPLNLLALVSRCWLDKWMIGTVKHAQRQPNRWSKVWSAWRPMPSPPSLHLYRPRSAVRCVWSLQAPLSLSCSPLCDPVFLSSRSSSGKSYYFGRVHDRIGRVLYLSSPALTTLRGAYSSLFCFFVPLLVFLVFALDILPWLRIFRVSVAHLLGDRVGGIMFH